jgi:hypothetical protein
MNALINLNEFSLDPRVKIAAQILLDYTTVKFAISSNRLRRVGPFRRLKERVNRPEGDYNDFFAAAADPQLGFFAAYTGLVNPDGHGADWLRDNWVVEGLIAGLAPYRPPAAAYELAWAKSEAVQHRFYHGERPAVRGFERTPLLAAPERAAGGVEIYYSSPSFLLTAGGMFLNSGYGHDELMGFKDAGAVQSTTLLPTRADLNFEDVIRFDPYPNDRHANNTGVYCGFACGANFQIPDRWKACSEQLPNSPWIFINFNTHCDGIGPLGFYVAAYRRTVNILHAEGDGTVTTEPVEIGFMHAIEASQIDFTWFVDQTRRLNPNLQVDYAGEVASNAGEYVFKSADGHTYTFHLWPASHAYRARVIAMDGTPLEEDLTRLPLAESPYLSSPGHEGYVEIRHPGCTTPLVLDFRDALQPIRVDNTDACPQWLRGLADALSQRVWALHDLAARLLAAGQQTAGLGDEAARVPAQLIAAHASEADRSGIVFPLRELSGWVPADEGVRVAQAAAVISRELAAAHPDNVGYLQQLVWALHDLAARLLAAGQQDEAAAISAEAATLQQRLQHDVH